MLNMATMSESTKLTMKGLKLLHKQICQTVKEVKKGEKIVKIRTLSMSLKAWAKTQKFPERELAPKVRKLING
jgi:hypothetical protein